jgi:two-component system, NtrC family, response regulator AtoC
MRVLLLLDAALDPVEPILDALSVRGHLASIATREAAMADVTSTTFASADLIVADAEIAKRTELVAMLASASPGIEFVLVGARPAQRLADVIAQIERPVELQRLLGVVDEVADILDGERLREPIDLVAYETVFAGDSPEILALLRRVRLVARSEAPVWIFGDDGSGRAIIARAIHDRSNRRGKPFIAFNTAAHSDDALRRLLFEGDDAAVIQAARGTLFLEQISNAGPDTQRELVRFLEKKREDSARLIVGVQGLDSISGTQAIFSSELYYRLKVLEVEIPSLKERARDLQQIVARMLERLATDGKPPTVSTDTMQLLERYSFPGNLLELSHALTHAVVLAHGSAIEPQHLPVSIRRQSLLVERTHEDDGDLKSLDTVAKRFERDYLLRVLRSVGGNRGRAAEILGLSRKGLWGKLKAHGISDDDIERDASDSGPTATESRRPR